MIVLYGLSLLLAVAAIAIGTSEANLMLLPWATCFAQSAVVAFAAAEVCRHLRRHHG